MINQEICTREKQKSLCPHLHKLESALAAAYYPGIYPFQQGGLTSVAGALCYFLTQAHAFFDGNKRNVDWRPLFFWDINDYELSYPVNPQKNQNAWAEGYRKNSTIDSI